MLVAAAVLVFFGRTTDMRSLTQSALVIGLGIDVSEDAFVVSTLSVVVSGGTGGTSTQSFAVHSAEGATLSEGLDKISQKMGLLVSLSHCNVLVLSKEAFEIDGAELFSPLVVSYSLPEQAAITATEAPPSDVLAARTGTTVASTYLVQSSLIQNLGGDGLTFVTVKDYLADTMSRSGSVNLPLIDVAEAEHPPEGQDGKTEGVAELTMGRNLVVFEGGSFVIEEELAQVTTMLVRNKVLGRLSVQTPAGDRFEFRVLNASPSVEADGMSVHAALDVTVSFMEAQGASAEGKLSPSSEAVRAAADDAADMLKERILACHRLSLETGADFLHLEEAVYRKAGYPLPKGCLDDIAFDCSVTVKVKEAG